jgi:hypothetical protein
MGEVVENLQALCDQGVRFIPLDVSDESHPAGVMFVGRVVETLRGWLLGEGFGRHGGNSPNNLVCINHGAELSVSVST